MSFSSSQHGLVTTVASFPKAGTKSVWPNTGSAWISCKTITHSRPQSEQCVAFTFKPRPTLRPNLSAAGVACSLMSPLISAKALQPTASGSAKSLVLKTANSFSFLKASPTDSSPAHPTPRSSTSATHTMPQSQTARYCGTAAASTGASTALQN